MKNIQKGIIVKGVGGLYSVDTENGIYECKARGVFRKKGIRPAVGDKTEISIIDENKKLGSIDKIEERKNCLLRPVVSNVDNMLIVSSSKSPDFDFFFVDKMCVLCEYYGIRPIIVINKTDIEDGKKYGEIYEKVGYKVIYTSKDDENSVENLKKEMKNGINVFGGFSGVGKSTLINKIFQNEERETGAVSKIERGKHTTRHSELFKTEANTYIADTPGFSSLEINFKIPNLTECFPEFFEVAPCKFSSCTHIKEIGCSVREALKDGKIPQTRYESYVKIYELIKDIKDWEK